MQAGNFNILFLTALPLVLLVSLHYCRKRRKALGEFADSTLIPDIFPAFAREENFRFRYTAIRVFLCLALLATIFRPQWGFTWKKSLRKGVDIVVAVDVSQSMLAQDVSPNRLERARRELSDLIDRFTGDRIALVAFAGTAFIETPLTLDYGMFRLFLDELDPSLIPIPGTNIKDAMDKSIQALSLKSSGDGKELSSAREKAVILITDGEDVEGDFSEIRELAESNSIKIFIIGVGTVEGSPIPTRSGFKRDNKGGVVISKLKEDVLRDLAKNTGGVYVQSIGSEQDTFEIYDAGIKAALKDSTVEGTDAKRWSEYFQIPLLLAIFLLLFEAISRAQFRLREIPGKAPAPAIHKIAVSNTTKIAAVLLALCCLAAPMPTYADNVDTLGKLGKSDFESGEFQSALENFSKATTLSPNDYRFYLGQGASYYRLKEFEKAIPAFQKANELAQSDTERARALYDIANSQVQMGKYKEAIETYNQSLKLVSQDREASENLAYAKKLLDEQEQEKDKKDQEKQKPDQNQQNSEQEQDSSQSEDDSNQNNSDNSKESESDKNKDGKAEQESDSNDQPQDQSQNKKDDSQGKDSEHEQSSSAGEEDENKNDQSEQSGEPAKQSGERLEENQLSSVLDSIEESKGALMQHRRNKAMQGAAGRMQNRIQDW